MRGSMRCTSADIISTVEFDHTGDYLATGDKGGRVVLFERNESVSQEYSVRSLFQVDLSSMNRFRI
jgi:serine/threonine-protein phosphatase 2A regulatory subunit B